MTQKIHLVCDRCGWTKEGTVAGIMCSCGGVFEEDYACKGCRDFADNLNPRDYPTAAEPYHPDCPYHYGEEK